MYATINIDFDVFKAITARRTSPEVSENDVLREVLGLGPATSTGGDEAPRGTASVQAAAATGEPWVWKGVTFPHGTEFRAEYGGQAYQARVENGALIFEGKRYKSPSAAASEAAGTSINGWKFWEARLPGRPQWTLIYNLRG